MEKVPNILNGLRLLFQLVLIQGLDKAQTIQNLGEVIHGNSLRDISWQHALIRKHLVVARVLRFLVRIRWSELVNSFNKLISELIGQHGITLHVGAGDPFLHLLLMFVLILDFYLHFVLSDLGIVAQALEHVSFSFLTAGEI